MKKILILAILLAGCSGEKDEGQRGGEARPAASAEGSAAPAELATLTGLYEGGAANRPNRMCIVPADRAEARFGLVVWGAAMQSCSGTGTLQRRGDTLTLSMAGDEACTISARISGNEVALPAVLPEGCAYYCGARASLGSARFEKKGATIADAAKATDLVGEPLCAAQ